MDPRSLYTFVPEAWASVQGTEPVLVHLLEGYVDAGGVSRTLCEQILTHCEHTPVVDFDADQLHDYRSRRPTLTFDSDHWAAAAMPSLTLHRVTDAAGRHFLLLAGQEPDTQWVRAIEAILEVARGLGVSQLVSANGIPMGVPHTRPLLITTHGTKPELISGNPVFIDRVQVPGSFGSLLEYKAGERGLAARGFVVHVPHYLAQGTFTPAALRVAELFDSSVGLKLPTEELQENAASTLVALSHEIEGEPELSQLVEGLEGNYDEMRAKGVQVPSADEIGRAAERFLAELDAETGEN